MKCKVNVKVGKSWFSKSCENAAQTYDAVCSIIDANKTMYPDQEKSKSDFIWKICDIFDGRIIAYQAAVLELESIKEDV